MRLPCAYDPECTNQVFYEITSNVSLDVDEQERYYSCRTHLGFVLPDNDDFIVCHARPKPALKEPSRIRVRGWKEST